MNAARRIAALSREFRHPALWFGVWAFGWLLCIVLSLSTPLQIPVQVPDGDKVGHFVAYAMLSAWSVLIFARRRAQLTAAMLLVLLGLSMEWAQGELTTTRMMDAMDALANTLGVLFGQLLALTGATNSLQRLEQWFYR